MIVFVSYIKRKGTTGNKGIICFYTYFILYIKIRIKVKQIGMVRICRYFVRSMLVDALEI